MTSAGEVEVDADAAFVHVCVLSTRRFVGRKIKRFSKIIHVQRLPLFLIRDNKTC